MEKTARRDSFSRRLFIGLTVIFVIVSGLNIRRVYLKPTDECTWDDTPEGVRITNLHPGGAAETAGLRRGDIILSIAGEYVTTSDKAQVVLDEQELGEEVTYLLLRDGEFLQKRVRITEYGLPYYYLALYIIAYVFLAAGLWMVLLVPNDPKTRVLFFLFLNFMLFFTLNLVPPPNDAFRWIALILQNISFTTVPALFLFFFLLYPTVHPLIQRKPWIRTLLFTPTFLSLIWIFFFIVFDYPPPFNLLTGISLWGVYFLISMTRLSKCYIQTTNPRLKQQIGVLRWGIYLGTIPAFLLILPSVFHIELTLANYLMPLMGLIPLFFVYAVIRHRLMDIEFIVKKSFVYTLLTGLFIGFYFIVVQFVGRFLQDITGFTGTFVLLLSTLIIAIAFNPMREKIQHVVDRAFYREAYDYRITLRQFARALNTLIDPEVLIEGVLHKIAETIHIHRVYFFSSADGVCYTCHHAYPSMPNEETVNLPVDGFFCRLIKEEKRPIDVAGEIPPGPDFDLLVMRLDGVLAVPLLYQERLLGFMLLGRKRSEILYSTEDVELLATVADQVAVAYENGCLHMALTEQERLKRELEIAQHIQMKSLPQENPNLAGFDIYGTSLPATEVGGDYYDYLPLPDGSLGIVIGDVSGKGTSAALYMSKIQGFFRALSPLYDSPKDLLCRINRLVYENVEDKAFMTLISAVIDPRKPAIRLVRAGHTSIFHYENKKKICNVWAPQGIALALDNGPIFDKTLTEEEKRLDRGDVIVFYTDGLTEAVNASHEEFGEDRLEAVFCQNVLLDAESLGEAIIRSIEEFVKDQPQHDDMTLVVVKLK